MKQFLPCLSHRRLSKLINVTLFEASYLFILLILILKLKIFQRDTPSMIQETLFQEILQKGPITGRKENQEYFSKGTCEESTK